MLSFRSIALSVTATVLLAACSSSDKPAQKTAAPPDGSTQPSGVTTSLAAGATTAFKEARLYAEINSTDEDEGMQLFLDHDVCGILRKPLELSELQRLLPAA